LLISKPSTTELGVDYLGIIVGILALLITVLIGWQIYQVINLHQIVKTADQTKEQIMSSVNSDFVSLAETLIKSADRGLEVELTYDILKIISYVYLAERFLDLDNTERAQHYVDKSLSIVKRFPENYISYGEEENAKLLIDISKITPKLPNPKKGLLLHKLLSDNVIVKSANYR
ncbi:MAG: hypothetical protein ACRC9P_08275, partial [Bacteroides sp.]